MSTPWFDPSALAWIDPAIGMVETAWGGLLGVLSYAYARKGRAHGLVFAHLYLGLAGAAALVAAGALARLQGQPTAISGSLLSLGGPLLIAAGFSLVNFGKLYRAAELRRMQAMEI
jgi:hypothetical protein